MDIMRRCTILYILTKIGGSVCVFHSNGAEREGYREREQHVGAFKQAGERASLAIPVMGVERSGRVPGKGGHI